MWPMSCYLQRQSLCIVQVNKWFHVSCTDLTEEIFKVPRKRNGSFWATEKFRSELMLTKNKNNFNEKTEYIKRCLKSQFLF